MTRDPRLNDLLLTITAVLRKARRSDYTDALQRAWLGVVTGDAPRRAPVPADAACALHLAVLKLCEAAKVDRSDLAAAYMVRVDAGELAAPEEFDGSLDSVIAQLLQLVAAREPKPDQERASA
jgi:hypothetical protein